MSNASLVFVGTSRSCQRLPRRAASAAGGDVSRETPGGGPVNPFAAVAPDVVRVLALMILLGGTLCVLLRRDQPVSAGLFAATVSVWLVLAAPHLQHLPARLSSISVATWTAAGAGVGVLMLLGGLAVRRSARRQRQPS